VKRLLLDLNIVLDVVLDRAESASAARLWAALERGKGRGYIPAHGVTTIFYLVSRAQGAAFARRATDGILRTFAVAAVDEKVLKRALSLGWPDFEDAVCAPRPCERWSAFGARDLALRKRTSWRFW
jgi:predicted nucleic acid-binding protein